MFFQFLLPHEHNLAFYYVNNIKLTVLFSQILAGETHYRQSTVSATAYLLIIMFTAVELNRLSLLFIAIFVVEVQSK